jgi:hypothetical protein
MAVIRNCFPALYIFHTYLAYIWQQNINTLAREERLRIQSVFFIHCDERVLDD